MKETEAADVYVFDNAKGSGKMTETLATMVQQEKYLGVKEKFASAFDNWIEKKINDYDLLMLAETETHKGNNARH